MSVKIANDEGVVCWGTLHCLLNIVTEYVNFFVCVVTLEYLELIKNIRQRTKTRREKLHGICKEHNRHKKTISPNNCCVFFSTVVFKVEWLLTIGIMLQLLYCTKKVIDIEINDPQVSSSHPYKLLTRITIHRLSNKFDSYQPPELTHLLLTI